MEEWAGRTGKGQPPKWKETREVGDGSQAGHAPRSRGGRWLHSSDGSQASSVTVTRGGGGGLE